VTKVLETLAAFAEEYSPDRGGEHLKTALLAAVLTEQQPRIPAAEVIDLVANHPWDPRLFNAIKERDRLLDEVSFAALEAEQDGQVPA
jgi:hypothetical protein